MQAVLQESIRYVDFTIVWGHRGEVSQNQAYAEGNSSKRWPDSKHNKLPSLAVDFAPWPKVYSEKDRVAVAAEFSFVAGIIFGVAKTMGIELRWGGDWNGNLDTTDQKLQDWGHLELKEV